MEWNYVFSRILGRGVNLSVQARARRVLVHVFQLFGVDGFREQIETVDAVDIEPAK